jgi:osmotically-inducible protein OsmY
MLLRFVNPLRAEARAISQENNAMRKPFHLLVFVLVLALAYATAQTSGSSPSTNGQATTPSQPSQDQAQKPETQPGSSATATSSTDVQGQIQSALKNDPSLSNATITVSVTDDAVDLTGTVASSDEKRAARKIAKSYAGNRKIKDHLTVSGGSKGAPPGAMSFAGNTYSQSQSSQPQSSQSGTAQTPSTSQSPPTPNEPPNSQTSPNGSMTQTPSSPEQVPTSQQQTPGAPAAAGGDIQMQVQNALQKEPTLSNDNINVSVTDDTIELNGTVASNKEKQTAKRIAQSYAGNRKVKEHLTVSGQAPDNNATNPPGSTTNPSSTIPPDQNSTTKPPSSTHPPRK